MIEKPIAGRACLREPIPAIELAANLLDRAVTAHLGGRRDEARDLILEANLSEVRQWTEVPARDACDLVKLLGARMGHGHQPASPRQQLPRPAE
jgi:hypothetical protein